jgi:outer membrane protein OmpA-like peptidoglycan-associated protein
MRKVFQILFLGIVFHLAGQSYCTLSNAPQELKNHYEKAVEHATSDQVPLGLSQLKTLGSKAPILVDALLFLGDYYVSNDPDQSIGYYQKAISLSPGYKSEAILILAELEYQRQQFNNSLLHVNQYLGFSNIRNKISAEKLKKKLEFIDFLMQHPVPFVPVNLGPQVNSHNHEYHPYIRGFSEELVVTTDTFLPRDSLHFDRFGNVNEDIRSFKQIRNQWINQPVWTSFNTRNNEGAVTMSNDGNWLTYTQCNKKQDKGDCDLVYSQRKGAGWGELQSFGENVNTDEWESQPCFSHDGSVLLFVRDHMSQTDILMSKKTADGNWSMPEFLSINTGGNEHSPFLHSDGRTMYFISDRYPGMEGDDIFVSHLNTDGTWAAPINLGYPINTHRDELGISVSQDGKTAYFASNRKGGFGGMDIYSFELPGKCRPKIVHVEGTISSPIGNISKTGMVLISDDSGRMVDTTEVTGGRFERTLPAWNSYQLRVHIPGYYSADVVSISADSNFLNTVRADFKVFDLSQSGIVLKNVHFVQSKDELLPTSYPELESLFQWLTMNIKVRIRISGHTDNVGDPRANQELSEMRALKVKNWLIEKGISDNRLKSIGFGSTRPIVANDCEENKKLNRRVEFEVLR